MDRASKSCDHGIIEEAFGRAFLAAMGASHE